MATNIVLYNQLSGATTGGTWTKISGPSGNTATTPGTYNGAVDFASQLPGLYEYTYHVIAGVLTSTSTVGIQWAGDGDSRLNELCTTAFNMGSYNISPFSGKAFDDTRGPCVTGLTLPVDSGSPVPPEWGSSTYLGDLFYKIKIPSCTVAYNLTVTVTILGYDSPAKGIGLQIYSACRENECAIAYRSTSAAANMSQNTVNASLLIDAASGLTIYARVSTQMAGQYNISVSSDAVCENVAPNICEAFTKVLGFAPNFAIGFGPNFVFTA